MYMEQTMTVNALEYRVLCLLGKGKGGYAHLVEREGQRYVLKQIHHEPCIYYEFGDKLQSELRDYQRLRAIGVPMPELLAVDRERERILKEYIPGSTVYDLVLRDEMEPEWLEQVEAMCDKLYPANTNIDYFPTNFVPWNGKLYYIDYECNDYQEQWDFAHWGVKYWSRTPEFLACARERGHLPGRKIIALSFDDGTVYDKRFVDMLNRHGVPGTFNLNSGLSDFVWHCGDHPICRLDLRENRELYRGHEVACHSVHHPYLPSLSREELIWQVGEDHRCLREIFGREELGFGVPFDQCTQREIDIIREGTGVRYIRLSELSDSFAPPADCWHIPIHGLFNQPDIRERLSAFADSGLPLSLFVLCGHSYECEVEDKWDYMEQLLVWMKSLPGVEFMTLMEAVRLIWPES